MPSCPKDPSTRKKKLKLKTETGYPSYQDTYDQEAVQLYKILSKVEAFRLILSFSISILSLCLQLDSNIAGLAQQLREQQEMMAKMQQELNQQREIQLQLHRQQMEQQQLQQMAAQQPSLEKDISKLEDILVSRMEHSLAQHMHRENILHLTSHFLYSHPRIVFLLCLTVYLIAN